MQGTLEERTFAALSSFLDHGSSGFLATTRRCLCDASPSSRTASASSEGHTPKRRPEHPPTHSLYPVFALCVLAALCAIWRHSNVGALVSSAPAFGIFRSTDRGGASHFEGSLPLGNAASALHSADVKQSRIFGPSGLASSAPHYSAGEPSVRRLSEDEQIETPTGSIPIAPSLAFFSFLFFFAIFLQWLVSKIPVYPPPVSIVWFVFGMAAYGVASIPALLPQQPWEKPGGSAATPGASFQAPIRGHNILQTAILEMRFIDSSIVYYVMMPILLYEATQNINWHKFKKFLAGGLTLAVLGVALQGVAETPFSTFIMFVKLLFLGPAFGIAVGLVAYAWLLFFRRHPLMQCLAYITFCYVSYFLAEAVFSLSGPLTAVCYGLFIKAYGHIALDRDAQTKHHTFVAALALMANCTIFIVSGIVTYGMMSSVFTRDDGLTYWLHLLVTYLYLNAARIFMIIFFVPILRRTGYGLSWKEAVLLVWGGLRGGIVLALGLRIERDGDLDAELTNTLSFFISGSVFLILLINGITFELLYRLLNPYPPKPFRRVYLEAVMRMIDHQYLEDRKALENHWLFKGTDVLTHADRVVPRLGWRKVDRLGNLDIKNPDITQAFMCLHEAAIYSWVVPEEEEDKEEEDGADEEEGEEEATQTPSGKQQEGEKDARDFDSSVSYEAALCRGGSRSPLPAPSGVSMLLASPQPGVSLRDVITDTCTSDMMKRGVLDASTGGGAAVGGGSLVSGGVRGPSPITAVQKIAVSTKAAPGSVHLVSQLPEASQQGIVAEDKTGGAEGSHDQAYGDAEVTPSVVSSVLASPDAQPSRERERGCLRKRTEAEQVRSTRPLERQAHSLAALGQGLKPSESRGFDPKFNLRLIEHATTTAPADREVSVLLAPSEPCSDGGSEGGTNVDVLEVTLQGKDPMTQAPLYTLTCRGGGTAPGEHSNEKKKERGGGGGMVERALTTLKRVMAPLHVDATPVSRLTSSGTDFRRSRTVGLNSLGSKQEERGRRQGVDTPGLSKSKTGVGAFRGNRSVSLLPEGAGGGGGASFLAPASPCFNISLNGGPMIVDGNSPREPAGAPRFDTDATLIFNNLPDRSQGPRRHKRRLFRLLSGKQPANKHRTNLGAPDFELGGGGSCGSRRSFVSSAGSPPTHATPMEGKNYRIVPAAVPLASVLEGQTRLFRRLGTGPAPATADPMDEGHLRSMKEQEAAGGPLAIQRVRTSFSLASSESYFEVSVAQKDWIQRFRGWEGSSESDPCVGKRAARGGSRTPP
ncbi:uncharacterized protein LOC34619458 [Cyclospora cayetanensis]|uniref:Uncharacterized protein LOC34619458 n=1 Tax=Cyclospora cayetanensis TaxID=88456 RepID=A0A6P6S3V1_9EIME|nr:uncharacterized protein LOC34619458 [Cyclospora cayetanensis]